MNEEFAEVEFKFNKYGYPKKTKLKFQIITAIYMAIACGKCKGIQFENWKKVKNKK